MNKKELVLKTFHNEQLKSYCAGFWHHFMEDELVDGYHHPEYVEQNLAGAKNSKRNLIRIL